MKTRAALLANYLLYAFIFLFASCQKELSFEIPPLIVSDSVAATYTLGSEGSNCTGVALEGAYMSEIVMNAGNTAGIQVNVTAKGYYMLTTDTVNGISFSTSGEFEKTGNQTVILSASGTPEEEGKEKFSIKGAVNKCSFDITFLPKPPPATFTLAGAPDNCTAPDIKGSYAVGTVLTTANRVVLKVNVTKAGSYNITTNTVNGISFSGSGVFSATGTNVPVTLTGSGKPLEKGSTTLTADASSGCSFIITVADAPPVDKGVFKCKIDGKLINFTENAEASALDPWVNTPVLRLSGSEEGDGGNSFSMSIKNNDNSKVKAGTYDEKGLVATSLTNQGYQITAYYSASATDISTAWLTGSNLPPLVTGNPPFTIKVTNITSTRVKGTFSGKLANSDKTKFKTVTEGVFDLPIEE